MSTVDFEPYFIACLSGAIVSQGTKVLSEADIRGVISTAERYARAAMTHIGELQTAENVIVDAPMPTEPSVVEDTSR